MWLLLPLFDCTLPHQTFLRFISSEFFFQAQTIKSIAEYVKKNPRASEAQLKNELTKQIKAFAEKVAALQNRK